MVLLCCGSAGSARLWFCYVVGLLGLLGCGVCYVVGSLWNSKVHLRQKPTAGQSRQMQKRRVMKVLTEEEGEKIHSRERQEQQRETDGEQQNQTNGQMDKQRGTDRHERVRQGQRVRQTYRVGVGIFNNLTIRFRVLGLRFDSKSIFDSKRFDS